MTDEAGHIFYSIIPLGYLICFLIFKDSAFVWMAVGTLVGIVLWNTYKLKTQKVMKE